MLSAGMLISTLYHICFFHRLTVKNSIIYFCWVTAIGYVLRCMTLNSVYFLYSGQVVIGSANAYHLNLRFRLFQYWFARTHIKEVLTYIMLIMLIGKGFLSVTPYIFVDEAHQALEEQQNGIFMLYGTTIGICVIGLIATCIFYRENPPRGMDLQSRLMKVSKS